MSLPGLDPDGEARDALSTAVATFGPQILSNPQMLENIFKDLLPDSPREVSILVAAAQVDVADLLNDRLAQHMDADTAVRLTASTLSERRALNVAACEWAAAEFARALGHPTSTGDVEPGDEAAPAQVVRSGPDAEAVRTPDPNLGEEPVVSPVASAPSSGETPGSAPVDDRTVTASIADERLTSNDRPQGAARGGRAGMRTRRAVLSGAIAAVVVLAGAITLITQTGHRHNNHRPPVHTTRTSSTTTTGVPPTSVTPTTSADLSEKLAGTIPDSSQCSGLTVDQITLETPGASAAAHCTPDDGLSVLYAIFPSSAAAATEYATTIRDAGSLTPGSCLSHGDGVTGPYVDSTTQVTLGDLACYSSDQGQNVLWWHFSDNIVSLATSATLTLGTMLEDWKNLGPT